MQTVDLANAYGQNAAGMFGAYTNPYSQGFQSLAGSLGNMGGALAGMFWFHTGVEEVFAVSVLPGYRNPVLIGPDTRTDATQTVWLVPPAAA